MCSISNIDKVKNTKKFLERNVFKLGHGYVSKDVLLNSKVSAGAKALYSILCVYSNTDGIAFPNKNTLCKNLNVSINSLDKYLKELVNMDIITKTQERSEYKGTFSHNVYTLNLDWETDDGSSSTKNNSTVNTVHQNLGYGTSDKDNKKVKNKVNEQKYISLDYCKGIVRNTFENDEVVNKTNDFLEMRYLEYNKPYNTYKQFMCFINSLELIPTDEGRLMCLNKAISNGYINIQPENYMHMAYVNSITPEEKQRKTLNFPKKDTEETKQTKNKYKSNLEVN